MTDPLACVLLGGFMFAELVLLGQELECWVAPLGGLATCVVAMLLAGKKRKAPYSIRA